MSDTKGRGQQLSHIRLTKCKNKKTQKCLFNAPMIREQQMACFNMYGITMSFILF